MLNGGNNMKKIATRDCIIAIVLLIIVLFICISSLHGYYVSKKKDEAQNRINSMVITSHGSYVDGN